jgi:hypothetical protein
VSAALKRLGSSHKKVIEPVLTEICKSMKDYQQRFNLLVEAGFVVERMVEPDSRQRYPYDPWYGLWSNTAERLRLFPATIIFKSRKS